MSRPPTHPDRHRPASSAIVIGTPLWLSVDRGGSALLAVTVAAALLAITDPVRDERRTEVVGGVVALASWLAVGAQVTGSGPRFDAVAAVTLFVLTMWATQRSSTIEHRRLLSAVALAGVAHAVVALVTVLLQVEPFALETESGWRAGGLMTYPNLLGLWMVAGVVVCVARAGEQRAFWLGCALIQTGALLATGSRAALALLAVGLIATVRSIGRRAAVVALTVVAAIGVFVRRLPETEWRRDVWAAAIDRVLEAPLWGSSESTYLLEADGESFVFGHAHNELLQLAVEHGVLVPALGAGAAIAVLRRWSPETPREVTVVAAVIALSAMVDLTFRVPAAAALLGAMCGIATCRPGRAPSDAVQVDLGDAETEAVDAEFTMARRREDRPSTGAGVHRAAVR